MGKSIKQNREKNNMGLLDNVTVTEEERNNFISQQIRWELSKPYTYTGHESACFLLDQLTNSELKERLGNEIKYRENDANDAKKVCKKLWTGE